MRMFITVIIALYTSRVILQVLGADDFGLYQTVGGIVGFLAFINQALSSGTSRFITVALGAGDRLYLTRTFSLTFWTHLILALLIVIAAESVGLWYFNHKMIIPADRFQAGLTVFHISIVSAFITILQVPFTAEVIAHEHLSVFAFAGIAEVMCKLGIVYMLTMGEMDKLVLYAILLLAVQASLFIFYACYCFFSFSEARVRPCFDRKLFHEIIGFSGWSLFSNGAIALSSQGIVLLLNLFFAPAVVAARAISLQVTNVASQFVNNFRTAANPQIVKRYASGDAEGSKRLLLESTRFSYYLMLLLVLPACLLSGPILDVWLVDVPPYTVIFLQLALVQTLFQVFDTSFYTALFAIGRIRENALICPLVTYLMFPIVYILFKSGASPVALSWATLIGCAVIGLILKPVLIHKIAGYSWKDIAGVFKSCVFVTLTAVPVPLAVFYIWGIDSWKKDIVLLIVSVICVLLSVWFTGLSGSMKRQLIEILTDKR